MLLILLLLEGVDNTIFIVDLNVDAIGTLGEKAEVP